MALVVRIFSDGKPIGHTPVELLFDGSHRVERWTDPHGEVRVDPCRGANVVVSVNGIERGTYVCREGLVLDVDL